jgi:hypothetical protein
MLTPHPLGVRRWRAQSPSLLFRQIGRRTFPHGGRIGSGWSCLFLTVVCGWQLQ